jgi:uncharacterized membrane protein
MPAVPSLSESSPPDAAAAPAPFVRATRNAAVALLLAVVALGLAWELWLAPTGSGTLAVKVLPLLIPLAGLLKYRLYTYRWVGLLVWLYFLEAAVRVYAPPPGWSGPLAWGQMLLCIALFSVCTAHVRWRLKHRTQDEPPQPGLPV